MRTQLVKRLIHRKPGIVGSQFEQDPARFAEIYRVEIIAIDLRRDMQPPAEDFLRETHLHLFIGPPESHMMIGAAATEPVTFLRRFYQVDDRRRWDSMRPE